MVAIDEKNESEDEVFINSYYKNGCIHYEIETLGRGGVYFYNLTQILQLVKYSKDNFLKDLKRDYEYFGYQTFQKLMDKETITFGNDIYISNDIFEFYDFKNRRKDKRKVV